MIFSHLASNTTAWQQTLGVPGLLDIPPPLNDTKWGITGGQNALSWPHVDGSGFGTVVSVTTGGKYWILMRERRDANVVTNCGNMQSLSAFTKDWHPAEFQPGVYEYEGVHLTAGSILLAFF